MVISTFWGINIPTFREGKKVIRKFTGVNFGAAITAPGDTNPSDATADERFRLDKEHQTSL